MSMKHVLITLAMILTTGAPVISFGAAKIYSAPAGIDQSSDFAVHVDGQKAFVFFMSLNEHRENYLPAADVEFLGEKKVIVRNVVHDLGKKVIKKARESWVSFETDQPVKITVGQLADSLPLDQVMLIDELGNAVEHVIRGDKISFAATAGHK
ncbi:MAG: hypothetical protein KJN67_02775, partial [Pontiella sp.]|nr:hypothetical protein [Pontiella sp.]